MSNAKIIVPIFIGAAVLLAGARSISWETDHPPVGMCVGECYEAYKVEDAKRREAEAAMLAAASPADLGKKIYAACAGCHGLNGEGGVGPKLQEPPRTRSYRCSRSTKTVKPEALRVR